MASGKVKALNTVDVGAQVSGEVTNLYVEVGDEVKQGDLIAQIDQVTQKNSLSNEQASLEQSEAALQSAQAESLSKQASLKVLMLILPAVSLSLNKHSLILHACKDYSLSMRYHNRITIHRQQKFKQRRQRSPMHALLLIRHKPPLQQPLQTLIANKQHYESLKPMSQRLKKTLAIQRFAHQYQVLSSQ